MSEASKRRDKILAVDDTPETLGLLTEALEKAGLTVLVARDGESALGLLEEITPDLVLMDAVTPPGVVSSPPMKPARSYGVRRMPNSFSRTGFSTGPGLTLKSSSGSAVFVKTPVQGQNAPCSTSARGGSNASI
jgi:DNA-binding NarL/FixJ family response regulator